MKGYIYVDKNFTTNKSSLIELLSSDSFRVSGYEIRININKTELVDKWRKLPYEYDESDPLLQFVSVLQSLSYMPNEVTCDGEIDYTNIRKIRGKEAMVLNSIFCLPNDPGISQQYGVAVVKPTDTHILKQPKDKNIKNGETVSWSDLLPQDYWNSIIIADCYILKDKLTIERNLFPILDKGKSAASEKLQITILTQFRKEERQLMWEGAYDYIKTRYPKASIEIIDVKNASKEIHDRCILTNHYHINLLGGTDLIDAGGKSTKRTTIITRKYPQFYDVSKDTFDEFCESVKNYRETAISIKCTENKSFKNRLIY